MSGDARAATGWEELGNGVFRRRYRDSFDLNCGLVIGDDQALLIDTRCHEAEAAQLREEIGRVSSAPVTAVVNTHAHFDHCFGNVVFTDAALWGHAGCARELEQAGERQRAVALGMVEPPAAVHVEAVRIVPPAHLVEDTASLLVGGRHVELAFLGPGHTDHDLVVAVPDVGVVFVGDLVEQGAPPAFEDAYPTVWPDTVARLLDFAEEATFVPGHGDVVGAPFVRSQRRELEAVRDLCQRVAAGTLDTDAAVAASPFPPSTIRTALTRPL